MCLWRKDEAFGRAALSYFPFRRRAKVSGTMIGTELPDTSHYFCAIWASTLFLHYPDNGKLSVGSSCWTVPAWKKTRVTSINWSPMKQALDFRPVPDPCCSKLGKEQSPSSSTSLRTEEKENKLFCVFILACTLFACLTD